MPLISNPNTLSSHQSQQFIFTQSVALSLVPSLWFPFSGSHQTQTLSQPPHKPDAPSPPYVFDLAVAPSQLRDVDLVAAPSTRLSSVRLRPGGGSISVARRRPGGSSFYTTLIWDQEERVYANGEDHPGRIPLLNLTLPNTSFLSAGIFFSF